jgi:hypothetical protein
MTKLNDYLNRKRAEYGDKFDSSGLDQRFAAFYGSGQRIKVDDCGQVLTGTVGVTTGWRPVFLLMRSTRSIGSSVTLGPATKVLAVKVGRAYRPLLTKKEG